MGTLDHSTTSVVFHAVLRDEIPLSAALHPDGYGGLPYSPVSFIYKSAILETFRCKFDFSFLENTLAARCCIVLILACLFSRKRDRIQNLWKASWSSRRCTGGVQFEWHLAWLGCSGTFDDSMDDWLGYVGVVYAPGYVVLA